MRNVELISFGDDRALAEAAADQWLKQLETAALGPTPYCVALSGGRIARGFFGAVARLAKTRQRPLNAIHFFWGDERCVPPTDPESNFGIARELLLAPLGMAGDHIHRVPGEETPESAAVQAEAELRRVAPIGPAGQPVLDLIFLGLGEDGHVASLFPDANVKARSPRGRYLSVIASKPPPSRLTLSGDAIAAARQVRGLASGPGKEQALRNSRQADG